MHALTEAEPVTPENPDPASTDPGNTMTQPPRRQMIPVSDLTAHPGNVRDDLNLTEEFTASIAAEGVRIPLLITMSSDGGWRVIEGHRRLAAAIKAGLAEVPCDIDPDRAGDEAGQYLDMLLANGDSYRANYGPAEEAAALFAAHEAGATRTRLRKATGRTPAEIKTALAAGALTPETRRQATARCDQLTLGELAILAEFDGDEPATGKLLTCIENGYPLEHAAERIRQDRAEEAERERLRAELQAAGVLITDRLPDGASWLSDLSHDGQALTPDTHAACPGHGIAFTAWHPLNSTWYCTDPTGYGHASRRAISATSNPASTITESASTTLPEPDPAPDPTRRLVIAGNKAWHAAAEVRHRWLTASLFARKSLPREAAQFTTRQLLAMPEPLRTGLPTARIKPLFAKLAGYDADRLDTETGTATTSRLAVIALAPIVTAYEHALTDGEGRNTWRTDRYSPCPRAHAAAYLTFLAALGYQLSDIEQAVADGTAWTPAAEDHADAA